MKKNYLFLCLCLFVDEQEKKYKELELARWSPLLEEKSRSIGVHRREKKNITLEVCIYKELKLGKLEYCVAWNSSLPSSSSKWHFFYKKIHINTSFYEIRVFETQFTQQTQIPGTQVSKSDILLLILQTVVCC